MKQEALAAGMNARKPVELAVLHHIIDKWVPREGRNQLTAWILRTYTLRRRSAPLFCGREKELGAKRCIETVPQGQDVAFGAGTVARGYGVATGLPVSLSPLFTVEWNSICCPGP
jgi:hypothetical protein